MPNTSVFAYGEEDVNMVVSAWMVSLDIVHYSCVDFSGSVQSVDDLQGLNTLLVAAASVSPLDGIGLPFLKEFSDVECRQLYRARYGL